MKKNAYITPLCEVVSLTEGLNVMLTLSVHDEETEIVGAKENSEIWDDEEIPVPSNDDNGTTPIED